MKCCVSGESRTALGQQLLGAQSALFSADYWMTRHMYNDTLQQICSRSKHDYVFAQASTAEKR